MDLPPALKSALSGLLDGVSRKDLAAEAGKLSGAYRAGGTSAPIATPLQAAAYAVARAPATHAACAAVFARLIRAAPALAPKSMLDVGAGSGAAAWAAADAWPGIAVTMLDRNPALRALARRLADAGGLAAEIVAGELDALPVRAELVVASYVLAELPEAAAAAASLRLWDAADAALVLVEPGTPQGFARIRAARAALVAAGAHVAAPCTHDNECPVRDPDWCHFSQRLARSRDHMRLKGASVPFEDERYSYVAVLREKVSQGARILAPPREEKSGVTFKLCDETGLRAQCVAARDKVEYARIRRKQWGDLF